MPLKLLAAVLLASVCSSSGQYPGMAGSFGLPPGYGAPPALFGMAPGPYQVPAPAPRLPMVMMPRHSKSLDEKRRRIRHGKKKHHHHHHHSKAPSSDESDAKYFAFRSQKRREVLTPLLSYVNKNGYVLYQKRLARNPNLMPGRDGARDGARLSGGEAARGSDYDVVDSEADYEDSELHYDDIPEDEDDNPYGATFHR